MIDSLYWEGLENKVWKTKDGRELHVHNLDNKHLANLVVWCDKRLLAFEEKVAKLRLDGLIELVALFDEDLEEMEEHLNDTDPNDYMEEWVEGKLNTVRQYFGRWVEVFNDEIKRRRALGTWDGDEAAPVGG